MKKVKLTEPEGHYQIERFPDGRIARIVLHGHRFGCGQEVVANGRTHILVGTVGIIEELIEPHTEGRTTDVIEVLFDGEPCALPMKPKDLDLNGEVKRRNGEHQPPKPPTFADRQEYLH